MARLITTHEVTREEQRRLFLSCRLHPALVCGGFQHRKDRLRLGGEHDLGLVKSHDRNGRLARIGVRH